MNRHPRYHVLKIGRRSAKAQALLVAMLLLVGSAKSVAQMSDAEFYRTVDLSYPGLAGVQSALASGDTGLASNELLTYFQNRTTRQYFSLSSGGSVTEAEENRTHYFTVVSIKKFAGAVDGTIDWTTKDVQDSEWHYQFHRMYWLSNFGKVYASTRNEVYASACISDMLDWIKDNASGYPRTLDTGVRLKNWILAYQYLVPAYRSTSLSAVDHLTILKSLVRQCQFLRDNWRSVGNWGASETEGLGNVVTMFPELTFATTTSWTWWKDLVLARFQHHLTNDFFADGVQFETSPSYGSLEYRNLFLAYKLMNMNAVPMPTDVTRLFVKPLEYMMYIHRPDGNLTQFSDTDLNSYLTYLKDGGELFQRLDMLFAASKGAQGTPPTETLGAFPNGGVFVMRSGWGTNSFSYTNNKFLAFDMSSNEPWHAHSDIFTYEAYADGNLLIRDAGRYSYVEGTWRDYFKGTASHNTLLIDQQNQNENSAGEPLHWTSFPGFADVVGRHHAYTGLEVQRGIFFAKPDYWIVSDLVTGTGTHTVDMNTHLSASYVTSATLDPLTKALTTPHVVIAPSDTFARSEIVTGWVSDSYNQKATAPVLHRQKIGTMPMTFDDVIVPYKGTQPSVRAARHPVHDAGQSLPASQATSLSVERDSSIDWFLRAQTGGSMLSFGSFRSDARIACVRGTNGSAIASLHLADGTMLEKGDTLLCDSDGTIVSVSTSPTEATVTGEGIHYLRVWAPAIPAMRVNGASVLAIRDGNWLVYGSPTDVEVTIVRTDQNDDVRFEPNYPNPFNPQTVIGYWLVVGGEVSLRVYDMLGREIAILVNANQSAGIHRVTFNGRGLSAGCYVCRLVTPSGSATQKIVLTP